MKQSERLCWFCIHCEFYEGCPRYSEVTPGDRWGLSCRKGKFIELAYSHMEDPVTVDDFREAIETARECDAFELRDSLLKEGL